MNNFEITFPKRFLWGAGTSAYQVEGNNANSDWWDWETTTKRPEPSGLACRHYELYDSDFDLIQSLHHNCHRLSIEWSRVEPEEGYFSDHEIRHYEDVIKALKRRGIEPVVTLHHFTNPLWFARLGGWENKDARKYYSRYVEQIVDVLSPHVRFWVTINEPMVYAYYSYLAGLWPPQKKSFGLAMKVADTLALAHIDAYGRIHAIYKRKNFPAPLVSIAQNIRSFVRKNASFKNQAGAFARDYLFNQRLIKNLLHTKSLDFLGVNYYTRDVVDVRSWSPASFLSDVHKTDPAEIKKNSLGWDVYPEGLLDNLLHLKKYQLPIFILENGICTHDDNERWEFIQAHLKCVHDAMKKGAPVMGYLYWSLLDNYEWADGYAPRFGLVDVDYTTFKRTVRDSAKKYAQVCKSGILK
ncbi:MAG: glycoside hydrolase family 1 protein [Candidatus Omnitrophica bacterium]|nr:glycoside hydrolase family 1 protein [Candidatus Omnitrophota bacterium]